MKVVWTALLLLAVSSISLAQEASTADVATPQGLGLMMILLGLGSVMVVGLVMAQRESGDSDELV
jgi:hypothetical protein